MRKSQSHITTDLFGDALADEQQAAATMQPSEAKRQVAAPEKAVRATVTLTGEGFLSDRYLAARYRVSGATVWRWTTAYPEFPKPHPVTPGTTRWRLSELLTYGDAMAQLTARRAAPTG